MDHEHQFINISGGLLQKIYVTNHGVKNDVLTLRINGLKSDLETIVQAILKNDLQFLNTPVIIQSYPRSQYTVLVEIVIPE